MARIGWIPGSDSITTTLTHYPGTKAVRVSRAADQGLPSWTAAPISEVPNSATIYLSFTMWPLDVATWLDAMPAARSGNVVLTYHPEPEQQTDGDPTAEQFKHRWTALADALRLHPKRAWIKLAPIFTHAWQQDVGAFGAFWPAAVSADIDAIGWNVANPSSVAYRTPASVFDMVRSYSDTYQQPYFIAEVGAARITGDSDGSGCAAWMQDLADHAQLDGVNAWALIWSHTGGNDLVAAGRAVERDKLATLIIGASSQPPPGVAPPPPVVTPPPPPPGTYPAPPELPVPKDLKRWLLTGVDHTILITDQDLNIVGDPITCWTNIDCSLRWNEPGSGLFTVPGLPWIREQLQAGSRVVVIRNGQVLMAGPYEKSLYERSDDGENAGDGMLTVNFADDLARVAARYIYANPALPIASQTSDYWTYVGNAEMALRALADTHAGPSALLARRVPHLVLGAVNGVGGPVTAKALRGTPWGDVARQIAIDGGGLGFRTRQEGQVIKFDVWQPPDLAGQVRFSFGLGNLRYIGYERSAPTATAALVGGQGEGADRLMIERVDAAGQNAWGRYETIVSRPGNDPAGELQKDGDDALAEAKESVRLQVSAVDTSDQRFGFHYGLGSIVAVEPWQGEQIASRVLTVHLQAWPTAGEVISPTIGDQSESSDATWIKRLRQIDSRIGRLERTVNPATLTP